MSPDKSGIPRRVSSLSPLGAGVLIGCGAPIGLLLVCTVWFLVLEALFGGSSVTPVTEPKLTPNEMFCRSMQAISVPAGDNVTRERCAAAAQAYQSLSASGVTDADLLEYHRLVVEILTYVAQRPTNAEIIGTSMGVAALGDERDAAAMFLYGVAQTAADIEFNKKLERAQLLETTLKRRYSR